MSMHGIVPVTSCDTIFARWSFGRGPSTRAIRHATPCRMARELAAARGVIALHQGGLQLARSQCRLMWIDGRLTCWTETGALCGLFRLSEVTVRRYQARSRRNDGAPASETML